MEEFVCPRRNIAPDEAEKGIEDNDDGAEGAAIARREETEQSKYYSRVSVASLQWRLCYQPMVRAVMAKSCAPLPTRTARNREFFGVLKTSP
jgi:hypothetical protein